MIYARKKYLPAVTVLAVAALFVTYQVYSFEVTGEYELYSIISEGFVMLLSLAGVFIIQNLKDIKVVYTPLMLGFTTLFISLMTDTLDEMLEQSNFVTTVFEDLFQMIGYMLLVVGLWRWIIYSRSLTKQLHQLATTDHLTGANNRRSFGDAFNHEMNRAIRYANALSLIVFDLDRFKGVNDTYGHDAGDAVLKQIAELVRSHIRTTDIFARTGGEEFAILIPATDLKGAKIVAEKLRAEFERNTIDPVGTVTASFGVAKFKAGENKEGLLKRADTALYEAKHAGRNCVVTDSAEISYQKAQ